MTPTRTIATVAGVAVLALPTVALADHGKGHGKPEDGPSTKPEHGKRPVGRTVVVSGGVTAVDASAKTLTLSVHGGNKAGRGAGETVTVSLDGARIVAPDNDGDGTRGEIEDVRVGDHVIVIATKTTPAAGAPADAPTLVARQVIATTPKKARRNLIFKGTLAKSDAGAKTISVTIKSGNRAARDYKGQTVDFSIADARIRARDNDGNGKRNEAADLQVGDKLVVHVRLAKGAEATQPLAAKSVVDQSRAKKKPATTK
ncbi:hypothetical protein [Patulibacter defluvii]|uniref:hypothetical protein n=1 Tax=Patulibacter defluvii TaxID=3095358 RepID=UPI002A7541F6|nr:hypothetical protein [Patulibacter sp. DM4]